MQPVNSGDGVLPIGRGQVNLNARNLIIIVVRMAKKSLEELGYKPGDVVKEVKSGRIKIRLIYKGKVR